MNVELNGVVLQTQTAVKSVQQQVTLSADNSTAAAAANIAVTTAASNVSVLSQVGRWSLHCSAANYEHIVL